MSHLGELLTLLFRLQSRFAVVKTLIYTQDGHRKGVRILSLACGENRKATNTSIYAYDTRVLSSLAPQHVLKDNLHSLIIRLHAFRGHLQILVILLYAFQDDQCRLILPNALHFRI